MDVGVGLQFLSLMVTVPDGVTLVSCGYLLITAGRSVNLHGPHDGLKLETMQPTP